MIYDMIRVAVDSIIPETLGRTWEGAGHIKHYTWNTCWTERVKYTAEGVDGMNLVSLKFNRSMFYNNKY
jgi:hypothetical protein